MKKMMKENLMIKLRSPMNNFCILNSPAMSMIVGSKSQIDGNLS